MVFGINRRKPVPVERFEKSTTAGRRFVVEIFSDGTLREFDPDVPEEQWSGTWTEEFDPEMFRNCLRMNIGDSITRYFEDPMMGPGAFWSGTEAVNGETVGRSSLAAVSN